MADGYRVDGDILTTHATNLARITAKLDTAMEAANAQSIPTDAFGYLCQKVPGWFVAPLHDKGVSSVRNAIALAEEIRAIVGEIARHYDETESVHAAAFRQERPR